MVEVGNLEINRPTTDDPWQNTQYEIREEKKLRLEYKTKDREVKRRAR